MKILLELLITFSKIGAVTFGGGYAMLPILEKELVNNKKWITTDELMNYFAIGQCTPGIIFVNTATFVGNKQKGLLGGIFATLGSILPSIIIILTIATTLTNFNDNLTIQYAFAGISVMVAVLIVNGVITLGKKSITSKKNLLIALGTFFLSFIFNVPTIYILIFIILIGIVTTKKEEEQ